MSYIKLTQNQIDKVGNSIITWSVIILEILLSIALFMKESYRKNLFFAGVLFHLSIILIHGLFSFFFSITALLVMYLIPIDYNINKNSIKNFTYVFKRK